MHATKTSTSTHNPNLQLRPPGEIKRPLSVLAVDPGTRCMGYALFEGQDLVLGKVKDLRHQRWTKKLLQLATDSFEQHLRLFRPHVIVFESCHFPNSKNGTKLAVVIEELKAVAKRHGLPVFEYAPRTARKIVVHDGNATKRKVAETICQRYPQLYVHLEQSKAWQDTYWGHMFDASCVGMAFLIERKIIPPLRRSA